MGEIKNVKYFICHLSETDIKNGISISDKISKRAFKNCSSIRNIFFNKVTSVDSSTFENCSELTFVGWVRKPEIIELCPFCDEFFRNIWLDSNLQIQANNVNKNFSIKQSEKKLAIKNNAFKNCENLKTVILPAVDSKSAYIAEYAFSGCRALRTVVFGSGNYKIDDNAFYGCQDVTFVIPAGNTVLAHFAGKNNFEIIAYSSDKT